MPRSYHSQDTAQPDVAVVTYPYRVSEAMIAQEERWPEKPPVITGEVNARAEYVNHQPPAGTKRGKKSSGPRL